MGSGQHCFSHGKPPGNSPGGRFAVSWGRSALVSMVLGQIIPRGHPGSLGLWERGGMEPPSVSCAALEHGDLKEKAFCFTLSS